MNKPPFRVVLCSSVAVDYFLFLARCVRAVTGDVHLVHALEEGRYRRLAGSGRLARVWLRFQMYGAYPLQLMLAVIFARSNSVFVVTSNTFFAPAMVAALGRFRRVKVIHLLYDLFPDALEVAGALPRDGWAARMLGLAARGNMRWPTGVVFLGEQLRRHATRRWGAPRHGAVIDISTDTRLYSSHCAVLPVRPIRVHYGGQLGAMHDAEALAAAVRAAVAEESLGSQLDFSFAISGSRAAQFRTLVQGCGVEVGATVPAEKWRALAGTMHVGLVTLSAGGASVCLPSKTYAMMASGMAIIAICPVWSDLATLVRGNDAGWIIDNSPGSRPDQPTTSVARNDGERERQVGLQFAAVFREVLADPRLLDRKRGNAHRAAHERFGVAAIERRWAGFFDETQKL